MRAVFGGLRVPAAAYRLPHTVPVADPHARRRRRTAALVAGDTLLLLLAIGLAFLGDGWTAPGSGWWALGYASLTVALIARAGGYRFRLEISPFEYVGSVIAAAFLAATVIISARVLLGGTEADARDVVRWWAFATTYVGAARVAIAIAARRADRRGLRTLIVGAGTVGHLIAHRLQERPELGLRPVGFLDKEPREDEGDDNLPVLGASWDLEEIARREEIEHVVVTFSTAPHDVLLNLVRRCRALGLEVSLVPRLFEEVSKRIIVEHLGGIALLRVDQVDPRGWQFELKYFTDRVLAGLMVLALSPLLLTIAALVKLTSPGPVFYRQRRVGLDGREFDILKFRTMREAPEAQQHNAAWAQRAIGVAGDDAVEVELVEVDRRTAVGRTLRRWSLDELPQLLNILRGEMSFIGPRPEQARYVPAFAQHVYRYGDRHRVKSGLTGWAQIHGLRGDTSLADRIEWDNFYVENWSPLLDLKILALTLPAVLGGRAAE
jgi:exopolysaccharide biosynthesis polyprenyl glycosylphosphotransferase